jgi:hypothetical protein
MLHVQRKFSRPWCHWDSNCAIADPVFFQILFYKLASSSEGCALFQLLKAVGTAVSIIRMICAHLEPIIIDARRQVNLLLEPASIRG